MSASAKEGRDSRADLDRFDEAPRPAPPGIPMARLVAVELRKYVDTRAGFWLLVGVAIAAVMVTGTVLLWATPEEFTQATFTSAINIPTAVILPIIAVLSVTAEWTHRTGLTTFVSSHNGPACWLPRRSPRPSPESPPPSWRSPLVPSATCWERG